MANTKDKERTLAQELFMTGKHTQDEIAKMVGVTPKTIGVWAEGGRWPDMRAALLSTPSQVAANLREAQKLRSQQIVDAIRAGGTDKYGDEMLKMAKAIEQILNATSLSTYIEVMQDFMGWVGSKDHKFRGQLADYQSAYLNHKAGTNGN